MDGILSRMARNENRGRGADPYTLKDLARTHFELNSWDDIPKVLAYLDEMKIPYTTDAKSTQQGYKHRLTRAHREKQLKMSCQALHNAPPNRT